MINHGQSSHRVLLAHLAVVESAYLTPPPRSNCLECDKSMLDTNRDDWYMVNDELWEATLDPSHDPSQVMCWECFTKRLGRPLVPGDFRQYGHVLINQRNPNVRKILGL